MWVDERKENKRNEFCDLLDTCNRVQNQRLHQHQAQCAVEKRVYPTVSRDENEYIRESDAF